MLIHSVSHPLKHILTYAKVGIIIGVYEVLQSVVDFGLRVGDEIDRLVHLMVWLLYCVVRVVVIVWWRWGVATLRDDSEGT